MEKQLHLSKQQAAHLRENFQMVVGDNFDLEQELCSLRADIAQQVPSSEPSVLSVLCASSMLCVHVSGPVIACPALAL